METVSSLLAKALGSKAASDKEDAPSGLAGLPDSLRDLVEAINGAAAKQEDLSKKEEDAAGDRQSRLDSLSRQFVSSIQELASVTALLNRTQADAHRQAEDRAKRDEALHKREEAARARAEKVSSITGRQSAAKAGMGASFLEAVFGKGVGDFARNVLKAREKTRSDVAALSEARYAEKVGIIEDQKADRLAGAEMEKEAALAGATATYTRKLTEQSTALGEAVQAGKESAATLSRVEEAEGRLAAAKSREKSVAAEGFARLNESPQSAPAGTQPAPPRVSDGGAPATVRPVSPVTVSPTIVTPDGRDALAEAAAERTRREVAARNLEAEAATAEARDALVSAKKEVGAAPAAYAGAMAQGEMAAAESKAAREEMGAAIRDASLREQERKAEAVDTARRASNEAYAERAAGTLVSPEEARSIKTTNLMTEAIAPPAFAIIAKVMERFQGMFPVIEQTGSALIELGTALPATIFTVGGQIIAGLEYGLSQFRDAIWTPDVRKRYDKSDIAVVKATGGEGRADLFRERQEGNLAAYKASADPSRPAEMRSGLIEASRGPVRANAPHEFTYAETPSTVTGIAHMEHAESAVREAPARPCQEPPVPERALGVIPVGPSNGSVDSWR